MHGVVDTYVLQILKVLRGYEFPLKNLVRLWCLGGGINKLVRISNGHKMLSEMLGYCAKCCDNTSNRGSRFGIDL